MRYAQKSAIGLAALALLLSGCAEEPDPIPGFKGEPKSPGTQLLVHGYEEEEEDAAFPAGVRAYATDDEFTVVTMDSGSCPAVADLADIDQEQEVVTVTLTRAGVPDCTADLAPRTFVFEVEHDLSTFSVNVRDLDE